MTRAEQVLRVLQEARGSWVDGTLLATAEVGGSEGLRRLRELREAGYPIETRKHPTRAINQYRLVLRELPPMTKDTVIKTMDDHLKYDWSSIWDDLPRAADDLAKELRDDA